MNQEIIGAQLSATRISFGRVTARHLEALHDSVEQACSVPVAVPWDRMAAAHAEIFAECRQAAVRKRGSCETEVYQ
jgi:hypothetical protein